MTSLSIAIITFKYYMVHMKLLEFSFYFDWLVLSS